MGSEVEGYKPFKGGSEVVSPLHGDVVARCFQLMLLDGRRKLPDEEASAAQQLWRRAFQDVASALLMRAVEVWLDEHPRGRPNIGEIRRVLKTFAPDEKQHTRAAAAGEMALRHAAALVEHYETNYDFRVYTDGCAVEREGLLLRYGAAQDLWHARRILEQHGHGTWQDARAAVDPGWTPPAKEAFL